jgi:hypothetical protein
VHAYDREHLATYVDAARTAGADLEDYLRTWVLELDEGGYRERLGVERLERLASWKASPQAWQELYA